MDRALVARQQPIDAAALAKVRETASTPSAISRRDRRTCAAVARGRGSERRLFDAAASVHSVWCCSVTVHALHSRSRIAGSTGWSESFQSPWP
jgi:hypothetical protein